MTRRNRYRSKASRSFLPFVIAGIVAILLIAYPAALYSSETTATVTVTKTERITSGNTGYYLVFTKQGVFANADSIWFGKFNSSDLYATIKEGDTLRLRVAGWRVPFMSMYPNIIEATKL